MLIQCGDVYRCLKDVDIFGPELIEDEFRRFFWPSFSSFFFWIGTGNAAINQPRRFVVGLHCGLCCGCLHVPPKAAQFWKAVQSLPDSSQRRSWQPCKIHQAHPFEAPQLDQWTAICVLIVNEGQDDRFVWVSSVDRKSTTLRFVAKNNAENDDWRWSPPIEWWSN